MPSVKNETFRIQIAGYTADSESFVQHAGYRRAFVDVCILVL
jgi:hypothetical protein